MVKTSQCRGAGLTREGSSGSGVRGEPSGEEGQLRSLALVTSPSARASNEGNPSSSTGMLSRVSVSTASKLASFSSSIFLGGGKWGRETEKQRERWGKIGRFSQEKLCLSSREVKVVGGCMQAFIVNRVGRIFFSPLSFLQQWSWLYSGSPFAKTKFSPRASESSLSLIF